MSYNSPFTGNVIQPTDVSYRAIALSADTTLSWPINGNATDNYAARIMEVTPSTVGLSLLMPPADQSSVGNDALIRNVGAVPFVVKGYTGNTIVSIAAGEAQYIYITTNANNAGTWGIIAYGIGSSASTSASLAGYGLVALGATLNQSQDTTTFSSDTSVNATFRAGFYVWTGGAGTLTLGSSTSLGNNFFFSVRNSGSGTLTIAGSGGDLINGSGSITLAPGDSCVVSCSGLAFYTVGLGRNTQFNFTILTKAVTSGTYTLTSSEASNVIQKYTGTLTGNVTIIVPPTVQVYFVENATTTSSAYTVTLSTGIAGGTAAAISANNQSTLICDSVNLVNANTVIAGYVSLQMPDGTVSAPGLAFTSDTATGIYRAGSGQFNIAILGANLFSLTASGLTVNGTGTFTGGVSGGTF
jgi:hypothetical protein